MQLYAKAFTIGSLALSSCGLNLEAHQAQVTEEAMKLAQISGMTNVEPGVAISMSEPELDLYLPEIKRERQPITDRASAEALSAETRRVAALFLNETPDEDMWVPQETDRYYGPSIPIAPQDLSTTSQVRQPLRQPQKIVREAAPVYVDETAESDPASILIEATQMSAYCRAEEPSTAVGIEVVMTPYFTRYVPDLRSQITGGIYGSGVLSNPLYGIHLKDACGGVGFQLVQLATPFPSDVLTFQTGLVIDHEDAWNAGQPWWLEVRATGSDEILVCCQWQFP